MTQDKLRMQMLAGIITEGQYKVKLNENVAVAEVRRAMEAAIAKIKNPADIERRINNVKFVVYNSLDPNTNGGERPPSDFQFDDAWWDSTHSQATDSVIASIYGELEAAVKGKSFGEDPMNENEEEKTYFPKGEFKSTENFEDFLEEIDAMPAELVKQIIGKHHYIPTPGTYKQQAKNYDNDIKLYMEDNIGKTDLYQLEEYWKFYISDEYRKK